MVLKSLSLSCLFVKYICNLYIGDMWNTLKSVIDLNKYWTVGPKTKEINDNIITMVGPRNKHL